jgi:HSP20 family molecular chaperone IbpA
MNTPTKKRSFFERLTGSIRMEDDESPIATPVRKPSLYNRYEEDYEDDETVEASIEISSEEIDEPTEAQLAVDVYETNNEIVVKTMTAGVKKEDLQISVSRETLTIRGKRENDSRAYQHTYHNQELYWGSFSRTVELPDEVDIELASATEHHGLVTIKLPKVDKKKQATLKIQ